MVSSEAVIAIIVSIVVVFALISLAVFIYIFVYKKRQRESILKHTKFPILASPQNLHRELSFGGRSPLKLDIYIVRKEGNVVPQIEESFSGKLETRVVCGLPPVPSPPPPPPLHLRYLEMKKGVIVYGIDLGNDGKIPDDDLVEFKSIVKTYLNYHVVYAIFSSNNANIHQVIHDASKEDLSLPPPTPLPQSTIALSQPPIDSDDHLVLDINNEKENNNNNNNINNNNINNDNDEQGSSSSSGSDEEERLGNEQPPVKKLIKYIVPTNGNQVQWDQCNQLVEDLKVLMVKRKVRHGQSSIDLVSSSGGQS
ncbi:hypothetical protein DFA_06292 [Cavenderia fasciculata]|uniref:Uncharacterized protein n=1 Tax=Cavenderia fasciculata TaxID=261658 RepID=F4PKM2_CACFS|nr:uncharacterized protein DFA_06292 [Cavenderia fasciculata]EGG24146.1 hypothetical protein DFA_06292 [Cavenderia fasciculata]|eukprot:XP_004361997.1 hypothetical protein DFA_06292 [Cavenderia fasciculata]